MKLLKAPPVTLTPISSRSVAGVNEAPRHQAAPPAVPPWRCPSSLRLEDAKRLAKRADGGGQHRQGLGQRKCRFDAA